MSAGEERTNTEETEKGLCESFKREQNRGFQYPNTALGYLGSSMVSLLDLSVYQ